jgi:chromosome partitioning protein
MNVIAIANGKGGSVKSTLAANIAAYASGSGVRALLIDSDFDQLTLKNWTAVRRLAQAKFGHGRVPFIPVEVARIEMVSWVLERAADSKFDLVIIDTAAGETTSLARIFKLAHLVIIPSQPTAPDIERSKDTARVARRVEAPFRFLLTRVATSQGTRARRWHERYEQEGLALNAHLSNRVAFQDAMTVGMGVCEWAPTSAATREIQETYDAVRALLERITQ